jgi:hypothetical protein
MSAEIKVRCGLWCDRNNNANANWGQMPSSDSKHNPQGFRLSYTAAVNVHGEALEEVPDTVAGTPNGKVRIQWLTESSDVSNAVKFQVRVKSLTKNTSPIAFTSWDDTLSITDVSNGAGYLNECEVSIATASLAAGQEIILLITRDKPGDAADQLAADVWLRKAVLVADKAT